MVFLVDASRLSLPEATDNGQRGGVRMDGSKRILVVDDDELQRSLLNRFLAELGHETVCAGSGAQALALLDSSVDLVLLDLLMPEMDGFEVARQIRQNPALADIPIMMVTSLEGRQERTRGCFRRRQRLYRHSPWTVPS